MCNLQLALDSDEEGQYAMEEAERQWEAQESQRRSRLTSSFLNTAGSFIRTVSISGVIHM